MSIIFKGDIDHSLNKLPAPSKIFRQTGNITFNRINFKVPWFSNIFPDKAVEGGKQNWRWAVKSNKFIPVLTAN